MTPTIKKLLAIVTAFKEIGEASQASRERWQCCRLLEALDVRSVTGSRERRTAQEAKKPLQRCKEALQTSREHWRCCGLLEALDGSRGYNVSGKCKMAVAGEITVYTDHQNCSNFATTKVSTRRQAHWSEHLAEFNFKVIYRPGEKKHEKRCVI
jgi:hypothetical protein